MAPFRAAGRMEPIAINIRDIFKQFRILSTFLCHSEAVSVILLCRRRKDLGSSYFPSAPTQGNITRSALMFSVTCVVIFALSFT